MGTSPDEWALLYGSQILTRPSSSVRDSNVLSGCRPPSSLTRMPPAGRPVRVSRTWQVILSEAFSDMVVVRAESANGQLRLISVVIRSVLCVDNAEAPIR